MGTIAGAKGKIATQKDLMKSEAWRRVSLTERMASAMMMRSEGLQGWQKGRNWV